MRRGVRRSWLLRTVSAGSLCVALWSGGALAQLPQQKYSFDLPAQPLSDSLKEYARVSGQQIIFTEDLVWGTVAKPLHATLTAGDALNRLLEGTGLFAEHAGTGAVMIRRMGKVAANPQALPAAPPSLAAGEPTEHVVVTGLIYSLQTNLDIKRKAGGLIDVVSSEDIGKFPDVDL